MRIRLRGELKIFFPLLIMCFLSGCETEIVLGLSEEASLRIISDLAEGGIAGTRYSKGNGKDLTWNIVVDSDEKDRSLLLLSRIKALDMRESPVAHKESLLGGAESNPDERARSLSLSLEDSLERIPGVREARVHLVLQNKKISPLDRDIVKYFRPDSAAVLITLYPNASVNAEEISRLVEGATGVDAAAVALILNRLPLEIFQPGRYINRVENAEDLPDEMPKKIESEQNGGSDAVELYDHKFFKNRSMLAIGTLIGLILIISLVVLGQFRGLKRPIKLIVDERC